MTYPRNAAQQASVIYDYRARIEAAGQTPKPVTQSLYIDLVDEADSPAHPIHLGFRSGINALRSYLESLQSIGVNHVGINLRFNRAPIVATMQRLANELSPDFIQTTQHPL